MGRRVGLVALVVLSLIGGALSVLTLLYVFTIGHSGFCLRTAAGVCRGPSVPAWALALGAVVLLVGFARLFRWADRELDPGYLRVLDRPRLGRPPR